MSRFPGVSLLAALLILAACSRSPSAEASTSAPPAGPGTPTSAASSLPGASAPVVRPVAPTAGLPVASRGATAQGAAEEHLLDEGTGQPAAAVDPLPPEAASAGLGLPAPGRPRKPLVHAASETPSIVPIGSEIPDGPVAAADAPVETCSDPRPTACNLDYKPVCAEVDTGVRCITTPCPSSERKTFSSACKACRDPKVGSYVSGTCPNP